MDELDEDALEPFDGSHFGEIKPLMDCTTPWPTNFKIPSHQEPFRIDQGCDRSTDPYGAFDMGADLESFIGFDFRMFVKLLASSDDALSCLISDSQLDIWTSILLHEYITPRFVNRRFVDLAQINKSSPWGTLQFIHSRLLFSGRLFEEVESCLYKAYYEIRLEKLSIHFLFSLVVVVFVFEYLIGYVERGVWATYSDTSWEFRASYVSIELRLAAYFWFKFRACPAQPADRGLKRAAKGEPSVSRRNKRNKFEPRLKAILTPTETSMKTVWLREYDTFEEAAIVFWVGAYYYDRWDRFNSDVLSWCQANLPPIPSHENDKTIWVLKQAKKYGNVIPHSSPVADVEHVAEELQRGGSRVVAVRPGTGDGGGAAEEAVAESNSIFSVNDLPNYTEDYSDFMHQCILSGYLPDLSLSDGNHLAEIGDEQVALLSVDDYAVVAESGQGDVSGPGVLWRTDGLNRLGPFAELGAARQQQNVQHVQQSCEGAIVPEAIQPADIPEEHAHELEFTEIIQGNVSVPGVLRSINPLGPFGDQGAARQQQVVQHVQQSCEGAIVPEAIQPADIPEEHALELEFTETIQSAVQELLERGWSCTFQHSVISTKFSVAFSRRGGQDLPKLTTSNYSAFLELHKQGWKTTLEPISSASPQDGDHSRLQPLSGSRDLCRACMESQKIANL